MSGAKRESWGSLRKLPSGRWQVRYPGPDGKTYTARTDEDKPRTFLTKTDARTWLASLQTRMERGLWEPLEVTAARLRAEVATSTTGHCSKRSNSKTFHRPPTSWRCMSIET